MRNCHGDSGKGKIEGGVDIEVGDKIPDGKRKEERKERGGGKGNPKEAGDIRTPL